MTADVTRSASARATRDRWKAAYERYEQYTSWMIRLDCRSGRIESDAVWDGLSGWRKDALLFLPDPARVAAAIGELPVVTEASGATSGWWCGQDVAVFATPHPYGSEEPSAAVWVLSRTRAAGGHALAGLRRAGIRVWRELEREEVAPDLGSRRAGSWTRGGEAASSPIIWLVLTISLSRNTLHERPRLAA